MSARSYGHYDPLAQTLDAVGDRWALLVVRELLWGPLRFTDLQDRLPGIGTNQLSTRLRELEADGIAARRLLPPPAASAVYELTEQGARLEPALLALVRFGLPRLRALSPVNTFRPAWAALALRALAGTGPLPDRARLWEVRVEDVVFHTRADPAGSVTRPGPAPDPDQATAPASVIRTDTITAFALAQGRLTQRQAREQDLLHADDAEACAAWAEASGLKAGT
ncbi:MAG TPA: helix-turn-helix domain-containing protein [Actinocrinis sp.]|jgi:DNA-binding HxlR family transcriptional regulator